MPTSSRRSTRDEEFRATRDRFVINRRPGFRAFRVVFDHYATYGPVKAGSQIQRRPAVAMGATSRISASVAAATSAADSAVR